VLDFGPPIYISSLTLQENDDALRRTLLLAQKVDTLILEHHLMRSKEGERRLDHASSLAGGNIVCDADFMGLHRNLLEAERASWYKRPSVPKDWYHYANGEVDVNSEWSDKIAQVRIR